MGVGWGTQEGIEGKESTCLCFTDTLDLLNRLSSMQVPELSGNSGSALEVQTPSIFQEKEESDPETRVKTSSF